MIIKFKIAFLQGVPMVLKAKRFLILSGMLAACGVFAQNQPVFDVIKLGDHIYELRTDGGGFMVKVVASVGEDGILVVDTGQKRTAIALCEALAKLGNGTPRIIINTHSHREHTEGNLTLGKGAIIIAHANARARLQSGLFLFDEFSADSLPQVTFTDALSLFFNGEEIKLSAFPGAHDNSDIVVWFTRSRIACVGALSNGHHFPSVDGATGDICKYAETVERAIAALPEDVRIIPGHGEDGTMAEWRLFQDMLAKTADRVRQELAQGKDLAALQKEDVLKDWQSFEGSYTDRNDWLESLVAGFQNGDAAGPKKTRPFEPLYHAFKAGGFAAASQIYRELKAHQADAYIFDDLTLSRIADKVYESNNYPAAIAFAELCLSEFPKSELKWRCHNVLGFAHEKLGHKDLARQNLELSLQLNPRDSDAAEMLKKLGKPQGGTQ
jgi:glyoxylase-like metal-dependent hydrolase (beta-lactamase superfamily II)